MAVIFFNYSEYVVDKGVYMKILGVVHNETYFGWFRVSLNLGVPDLGFGVKILDVILYMSPKVINIFRKPIDEKVNIYGMWFLLGGDPVVPFDKSGSIQKFLDGVPG